MEMVIKFGIMEVYMKDSGWIIYKMEKVDSFIKMVEFMKEIGKMVRLKDMELLKMLMVQNTLDNG